MNRFQQFVGTLLVGAFAILAGLVGPLVLLFWWVEDRFGPEPAGALMLLLFGAGMLALGAALVLRTQKITLVNIGDFIHDLTQSQKAQANIYRHYAQAERDALKGQVKVVELTARERLRLAREQEKHERLEQKRAQQAEYWLRDDTSGGADSDDFAYIE